MCGIAGFFERCAERERTDAEGLAGRMTDCFAHRGPDDRGVWIDQRTGFWLGHRRRSILDLSPTVE